MEKLILACQKAAYKIYAHFDASHDVDHIERVMKNARDILATEPTADKHVVMLGVILHDIEDPKYTTPQSVTAEEILKSIGADETLTQQVLASIKSVSFSGGNSNDLTSIEGAILRDADRLDAMGAIGIARAFAFGGARGRKLYAHKENARKHMSEIEYRTKETATVTHFHEKLLLLKELMVTKEGRRLAEERHDFMKVFLTQLTDEVGESY